MNKKIVIVFILILLISILALGVLGAGLIARIGDAKKVLYPMFESDEPLVLDEKILLKNMNNISIMVTLKAFDELYGLVEFDENPVYLSAGEETNAEFQIRLPEPGIYEGKILSIFQPDNREYPNDKRSVILASSYLIFASDTEGSVPNVHPNENATPGVEQKKIIIANTSLPEDYEDQPMNFSIGTKIPTEDYEEENDKEDVDKGYVDTEKKRGLNFNIYRGEGANPYIGVLITVLIIVIGLVVYFLFTKK